MVIVPDGDNEEGSGASGINIRVVAALSVSSRGSCKRGGGLSLFSGICKLRAALASCLSGCDWLCVGSVKWVH